MRISRVEVRRPRRRNDECYEGDVLYIDRWRVWDFFLFLSSINTLGTALVVFLFPLSSRGVYIFN